MDWFSRRFLKAALVWLGLGVLVGLAMALRPQWTVYRPAHAHLNLVGFVAMTIFGVAYHVIPRFSGHRLHSPSLAGLHWYLANIGLAAMVAGFAMPAGPVLVSRGLVLFGGVLTAAAAYLFIYNIWRTLDGSPAAETGMARSLRVMGPPPPQSRKE